MPVNEPRKVEQNREIKLDQFLNIRALNLDSHRRAIRQPGRMHLRNRCAANRFVVETLENFGNRLSQFFGDDGSRLIGRERWHLGLQLAELNVVIVRDEVSTRTDDLAKFYEGWAQFFESEAHSFGKRF